MVVLEYFVHVERAYQRGFHVGDIAGCALYFIIRIRQHNQCFLGVDGSQGFDHFFGLGFGDIELVENNQLISAKQDNSIMLYVPISFCGLMGCDALEENYAPTFRMK